MQPRQAAQNPVTSLILAALVVASVPALAGDGSPAAHAEARCGDCHGGGSFASAAMERTGPAAAAISARCAACHDGRRPASDRGRAFHAQGDRACVACHVFHDPSRLRAGEREFRVEIGETGLQGHCAACHRPGARLGLIDGAHRFAAEAVYHDDSRGLGNMSPSDGCLICHGTGGVGLAMPEGAPAAIAINLHASHPIGIPFTPGQGRGDGKIRQDVDPRLTLPDGRIECVTCHSIPGGTKDLLVPFDDPYALCLGCHLVGERDRAEGPLALAGGR